MYILDVNSIVLLACKFHIKSTECTYHAVKVEIFVGTQSAGLLKLKQLRQRKYNKRPPLRTALDDLYSLESKCTDKGNMHESQSAGTSKVVECGEAVDSTDVTSTDVTTDDKIPAGISFDQLHPPSPKVPKGGKVKKSKEVEESLILKHNESYSSSDVDMRLSGRVASDQHHNQLTSDEEESGKINGTNNYIRHLFL